MSRGFSSGVLATLYAVSAGDPMLALLTITHPKITTRRHVRNTADVVSRSQTFTAAAFDVRLPEQQDEAPPTGTLVIDTVDETVISDLLKVDSHADVLIELVLASSPDTVLASYRMRADVSSWTVTTASIELGANPVLSEQYPGASFTPSRFPGMFKG